MELSQSSILIILSFWKKN